VETLRVIETILSIKREPDSGKLSSSKLANNAILSVYSVTKMSRMVPTRVAGFTLFTSCAVGFETEVFVFLRVLMRCSWWT
jgi:hypothetical protein